MPNNKVENLMCGPWNKKKLHKKATKRNRYKYHTKSHWLVKENKEIKTRKL